MNDFIPEFESNLRKFMLKVPVCISGASGIKIFGKLIKSLVFTTDPAIIRNVNADSVIAVHPFFPQPIVTQAVMLSSDIPVFCGIGGDVAQGKRAVNLATYAEFQGAIGVVLNAFAPNEILTAVRQAIDIPVVVTAVSKSEDIEGRIEAGASIINVSGGANTSEIVSAIREKYPSLPIIATGGQDEKSINETIAAGANAITWTPPSSAEILTKLMNQYRSGLGE